VTLALITAGAAGLFIGARFLAPVILVATLIVVMVSILTGFLLDWSLKLILSRTLYLILTLQGCYLIGLALTVPGRRRTDAGTAPEHAAGQPDRPQSAPPQHDPASTRASGLRRPDRTLSLRRPSG
jgi:hypothetical protein